VSEVLDVMDVSVIVVHHNSPDTLLPTLDALLSSGVPQDAILLVDNSSAPEDREQATSIAGSNIEILHVDNRGYAAAVNEGLQHLSHNSSLRTFTLISTHESLPAPRATGQLRAVFDEDSSIAVSGPTLLDAASETGVWSIGGYLSKRLHLPRHIRPDKLMSATAAVVDREWLDGAFTMYRTHYLLENGLDERYFLYFEETDLHTRLRRRNLRVVWVPDAVVSQLSSGIPARLLGRNMFIFQSIHFSRTSGRFAVSFEAARALVRFVARGRGTLRAPFDICRGWLEGESHIRSLRRASQRGDQ